MKKLMFSLCFLLLPLTGAMAQTYDALWKEAETAAGKDHPQTALTFVDKVYRKALDEGNDGQLLRAMLSRRLLNEELSPDSGHVSLERMEAALQQEKRPAMKAVWHAALSKIWGQTRRDTAAAAKARAHLTAATRDVALLGATRTTDFLPVLTKGADSRLYNDDMLSLIGRDLLFSDFTSREEKQDFARRMIQYYQEKGNRSAALLATLDSIGNAGSGLPDDEWQALLTTAQTYEDLPLNIETYIALMEARLPSAGAEEADSCRMALARRGVELYGKERQANYLRNVITRMEQPSLHLRTEYSALYPGETYTLTLEGRNIRKASLRLTRLDATANDTRLQTGDWRKIRKIRQTNPLVLNRDLPAAAPWHRQKDSLRLTAPAPGVYLCELTGNGKHLDYALLYVSRLKPLTYTQPDGRTRVTVVDAKRGTPLTGTSLTQTKDGRQIRQYAADADGNILLPADASYGNRCYPAHDTDRYYPGFSPDSRPTVARERDEAYTVLELFTDRAIYRPGQTVRFGGIAYSRQGDNLQTVRAAETTVRLLDASNKEIASQKCVSDDFGTLGGEFVLPHVLLPGRFSLLGERPDRSGRAFFRVEEYKRPTFTVGTTVPDLAYAPGDTVIVEGKAETYTGLPVSGAGVRYHINVHAFPYRGNASETVPVTGETVTDSAGHFRIPVYLKKETATDRRPGFPDRYHYIVTADVTAENGETVSTSQTVATASRKSWIETSWPASVCKENLPQVVVRHVNANGRNLTGQGSCTVLQNGRTVAETTFTSGKAFRPTMLTTLPSGEYDIISRIGGTAPDTCRLLLFSETDTRPSGPAVLWQYVRHSTARDSVHVIIGSPRDSVTLFYDLYSGNGMAESRRFVLSDSLLHFRLAYRPEYGDGATATFAFVKDGKLYRLSAPVEKPRPDKRLCLQWSTFRNRLVPGQQEEWRLRITHPDGSPAEASLMARLYDASLDAFGSNPWNVSLYFGRNLPFVRWDTPYLPEIYLYGSLPYKSLAIDNLLFTSWNEQLFGNSRVYSFLATGKTAGLGMLRTAKQMSFVQNAAVDTKNEAKMEAAEAAPPTEEADAGGSDAPPGVTPRSNFAETAFFHPALRTDAEGGVSISFTLPESLTSWNFNALAHTRSMETGTLDTTVIARKDFMVQAALPRFVRTGDRVVLSAILRNLTDRPIEGTLSWQLTDPQTNRVVKTLNEKFSLVPSGATSRDFGFTAPDGYNLLACRVVAAGNGFSDGEEHPLPILPDRVEVTRSLPFSVTETGMRTLRIDTLWNGSKQASDRRLTVETASNPTWYAVSALPVLADDECHSAAEWATRYYALTLGSSLASTLKQAGASFPEKTDKENGVLSPLATQNEILLTETPWAAHAASETERAAALTDLLNPELSAIRRHTALDQLRSLQLPDGSWSWYKGMRGNSYITSEVAVLLARTRRLTGDRTATQPLERALAFLKDEIRKTVLGMKEYERKHKQTATLDEASLRYLYLRALMGLKPDNDTRYLLDKAERPDKRQTMYGKALVTVALAAAGRTEPALAALQSLTEHTVLSPETGRYFDTDRAQWSWASYRIPTQTAAIEALTALRPDNDPIAEEMRLWLMQAKRTQSWETSRATADAVYALLARAPKDGTVMSVTETTQPLLYTLNKGRTIVAASAPSGTQAAGTVGYSREDYTDKAALSANSITLNKRTKGLSWGSVRTSCTVPSADVAASSKGLGVTCLVQVERGGTWRLLRTGDKVRKGERLRKVFTLTADRDYDFVVLRSARAACLEPVQPLSGYVATTSLPAYRVVRDASTEYNFEQMRKGTHEFTEEFFASRPGTYHCGTSKIQSLYAPEFRGQTTDFVLTVE